jgi:hypothetical protein
MLFVSCCAAGNGAQLERWRQGLNTAQEHPQGCQSAWRLHFNVGRH